MDCGKMIIWMLLIPPMLQAQDLKDYIWTQDLNCYSKKTCGKDYEQTPCDVQVTVRNFDGGIAACTQLLKDKPKCGAAYRMRARAYANKGSLDAALSDLAAAIGLEPDIWLTYHDRAILFERKGDVNSALKDLDKAIALDPRAADAYNERGVAYYRLQRYDMALRDFDAALRIQPAAMYRINRANMLAELRRKDEALQQYQQVIDSKPRDWQTYNNLGMALKMYGLYPDAVQSFLRANAISEQYGNYVGLGDSYMGTGQYDPARKAFQRASDLAPVDDLESISVRIWEAAYFSGNYNDALQLAFQGLNRASDPDAKSLWTRNLGFSHLALGSFKNAAEIFQQAKFIGVILGDADGGLKVNQIYKNGPADQAGVQPGDVLLELNGNSLAGAMARISEIMEQKTVFGSRANIRLMRNGLMIEKQVPVGVSADRREQ
jgi:tetratricopeptide (TPR) repeat protein